MAMDAIGDGEEEIEIRDSGTAEVPAPSAPPEAVEDDLKSVVEALLFAAREPVTLDRLRLAIPGSSRARVREAISELNLDYDSSRRAVRVEEVAGGFRLLTRSEFAPYVRRLLKARSDERLSSAGLETLSIVAYKQPISRAEIESIRGVQVGPILKTLLEKRLIRIVGRSEIIGRPLLYGTTKTFLAQFGLRSAKDLPRREELLR